MDNKKVAVIMLGNMRSYNVTCKNLEMHLLSKYDCDLYVCTYDKRFNLKSNNGMQEEFICDENIRNVYGKYIKNITIVEQDNFLEHYNKMDKHYIFGGDLDRLYTIQKLCMLSYDIFMNECYNEKRKYDVVIRMRPDINLNEKIELDNIEYGNNIYIPSNNSGGEFNDHIAYGNTDVMTKYLTYYKSFGDVDKKNICDVSVVESGLKKHLELSELKINRINIKYELLRDTKLQKIKFCGGKIFYMKKY